MDRKGRNPRQPSVRGGRVSKRGRRSAREPVLDLGTFQQWLGFNAGNTRLSGRGSVGAARGSSKSHGTQTAGISSTSRAAVPSTSTVCTEMSNTTPQPCSNKNGASSSKTAAVTSEAQGNTAATAAANAHLSSVSGVVTVPPIYNRPLSSRNLVRIKGDLMELYRDPPPGIQVMQDESNMTLIHVVITGQADTPYEGGYFYFLVRCHANYPVEPPSVTFMTTGGGKVRFNPNLYKSGKVCLSVLGTWQGPRWTPVQTLSSLLVQIQSAIFNEKPYHNEPGYARERRKGDSDRYNEIIQHETIRVAVIGTVINDFQLNIPTPLMEQISRSFLTMYDIHEAKIISKLHLNGTDMKCPLGSNNGKFMYDILLQRVRNMKTKLSLRPEEATPTPRGSGEPLNRIANDK